MSDLSYPGTIRLQPEKGTTAIDLEKAFGRSDRPNLEIDLGCGKGRFLLARAQANKENCFLGIDRREARILKLERAALRLKLKNIRLLCSEIYFAIENFVPDKSVSVYYLFFHDPWPKRRHHRRRLFDANFLNALQRTLRAEGKIHIATDHQDYFSIIRNILTADRRFAESDPFLPAEDERTNFELIFLGQNKPIGRCSFIKISREKYVSPAAIPS
ncbi:MAG: tRNA (guanosine(46)-N7)-methyltransferase TrmB [Kiritimatiellia bacterium]|nr:tRNA (guanosine(46)-N7)-methyltransferase TrmB [Kiritimatiellia bacterium]